MSDWRERLVEDRTGIARILRTTRRIAVLGIKTEAQADQPAFYVPEYMAKHGYEIVPVPVYYPEVQAILGRPIHRALRDIAEPVDMVNVFRRSHHIPPHVEDILASKPRFAWFQLGIRNDEAAEALARAGIEVVQDRCLLVEHRRLR